MEVNITNWPILDYYLYGVNIILFILYGIDKFKAKRKLWRIPERVLLGLGLLGGGIGGLFGMLFFRHKTKKSYFYIVNFLGILIIYLLFKENI